MSIVDAGRYAEIQARELLKGKGFEVFQADWIARDFSGNYILVEAKHQDLFKSPPFDGHGLPIWQVQARIKFQKSTGVIAWLYVLDKTTKIWYWQRLDKLESGTHFDTNGKEPRRIYPIVNFFRESKGEFNGLQTANKRAN